MNNAINEVVYWKLRIPLILFIFGASAALYQTFPGLFLFNDSFLISIQYIGVNAMLVWFMEWAGINEKPVHFTVGLIIILGALFIDFFFD